MSKFAKYSAFFIPVVVAVMILLSSCKEFLNPSQELNITEDKLFDDYYEYRSIDMGLYGLQQDLVEQLVVLGELRADLLTITPNADADLVEIYNLTNISENNKYASPTKFFKLISACNNFIRVLKREHPEVLDKKKDGGDYDLFYGEALCMRAWAYFNAVRIYGKVPYIPESLVTMEEIDKFINTPGIYIDSIYIDFSTDGYYNDTTRWNDPDFEPITLEKQLLDMDMVINMFTKQLESDVKGVGAIHYRENLDYTWETTIWNTWAWHALLGQMYLYQGDLTKAVLHFESIIRYPWAPGAVTRYRLDATYAGYNWLNIFTGIAPDNDEHIFTLWFDKNNFQQNDFQDLFEPYAPHKYMLKPTREAIMKWETVWTGSTITGDNGGTTPAQARLGNRGRPNDPYRGHGMSYYYVKGSNYLTYAQVLQMLIYKSLGDYRSVNATMEGYDTIVWKYSLGKERYDQDANFIIYRAGAIHLNLAEAYIYWKYMKGGDTEPTTFTGQALNILNDGSYYSQLTSRPELGVRGRVGLGPVLMSNIIYQHDPFTNEIIGYRNLENNLAAKQLYLDEQILDERARELAFEGERFYDIMRVAKRRHDPSFLAAKVSAKYPEGKRQQIYNFLLDENNWYLHFFD